MLEVLNLSKVYKSKKGTDVHALDGVTLRFPETGMVFLLGKSGSGKSTLLNVCGGLDSPTSGEIIVKGRSSKNFAQSDFDSYRNTFIGFIFQEYNILNEFSVEDNIALALELQGKPKDKSAINKLLEQIDLTGLAKRKPNTLSGGQKQRIAIARALIKSPEIIMADEPTGALDSNTGRQVLETLKKLSRDKLVIVVSHDREFAELYGDRIIELKDGKVLSDVTKTQQETKQLSENIDTIGDVLCVKSGAELSDGDFEKIKAFLKNIKNDIVIAAGEKDVKAFKKVSRITDSGSREFFADTGSEKQPAKQYKPEDSRFIRSKLPAKHAVKIGVSSLKNKPVRLFFTVILCTVAFVLFGLLSTMNFYDSESTFKQSMIDNGGTVMKVEKNYRVHEKFFFDGKEQGDFTYYNTTRFNDSELKSFENNFGSDVFGSVTADTTFNVRSAKGNYWINRIIDFACLSETNTLRAKINGTYPVSNNEIVISSYTANVILNCNAYDEKGGLIEISTLEEIIGKKLSIGGVIYKVTGIIDSGEIDSKYDALKEDGENNYQLNYNFNATLEDGMHLVVFVSPERLQIIADENKPYTQSSAGFTSVTAALTGVNGDIELGQYANAKYVGISDLTNDTPAYFFNSDKTALADNEAMLSVTLFAEMAMNQYNQLLENAYSQENYSLADGYSNAINLCNDLITGGVWKTNSETGKNELVKFTDAEIKTKINSLISTTKRDNINLNLGFKIYDETNQQAIGETEQFTIIGLYYLNGQEYENNYIVLTDSVRQSVWDTQKVNLDYYAEYTTGYVADPNAIYSKIYLPYDGSAEQADIYWNMYKNDEYAEDESCTALTGVFVSNLQIIDENVKEFSKIFLYVGLVLAVFAALLFSNFISVSISQKKKEIGILRAVGARSLDVFKIFFSESFVIAAVCIALSTVGSVFICNIINRELSAGIGASLFVFGVPSFLVLVAIALVTAIIATFLPVYNAAKKKPVDSIRAL